MTEAEWLDEADLSQLLKFVLPRTSDRKFRLLGVACCRCRWLDLTDERSRKAVEVAEKYADGKVSAKWLARKRNAARSRVAAPAATAVDLAALYCTVPRFSDWPGAPHMFSSLAWDNEIVNSWHLPRLARCIFGNPFRRVRVAPAWRTSTVLQLAAGIYERRAFDRLPILADALQDDGCEDADILGHCRGDGPHARGCWVVDLILGKS